MFKKFFKFLTFSLAIFCAFTLISCKAKINPPDIWYIRVNLNGGAYKEGNSMGYSAHTNVLKPVNIELFENFTMVDPTELQSPTDSKMFAGWYFDSTEGDYTNNWTEKNWRNACQAAQNSENGSKNVDVYAKWIDKGNCVLAFEPKTSYFSAEIKNQSAGVLSFKVSEFETAKDSFATADDLENPIEKAFVDWYLDKNFTIELTEQNIENQIEQTQSAYVVAYAKWTDQPVVYIEVDLRNNIPEEFKETIEVTQEYFDKIYDPTIFVGGALTQTKKRFIIPVLLNELQSMEDSDLLDLLPKQNDLTGYEKTLKGFYFDASVGEVSNKKEFNRENLLQYIQDYDNLAPGVNNLFYSYVYASWENTVTFNLNDGDGETIEDTIFATVKVDGGKLVSDPGTPERQGYVFKGWCIGDRYSNLHYLNFETFVIESDIVFYADWELE